MHAFLITGNSTEYLAQSTEKLAKRLKAKILEYPLAKIEDARNLNSLLRLSIDEPTIIVSYNIHEATEEALNAFLKNLEEPQENVYFALTAPTARKVLPTIVSRCQLIRVKGKRVKGESNEIEKLLGTTVGKKLAFIDKIKDRRVATKFTEELIETLHNWVHSGHDNYASLAKNLEASTATLNNLKANGNVSLQLTNLVVHLV